MTSIKLYADLDEADALIKGKTFSDEQAIANSFVLINCYAVRNTMYPINGPFNAFKHCLSSQVSCLIVGGMPASGNGPLLTKWTGSAYCIKDNEIGSDLHSAICYNQNNSDNQAYRLDPILAGLQKTGVVLIPEALSTFAGGTRIMHKLWEPFIWNYLFKMSILHPDVPVLFTTETAKSKFESAVLASEHRLTLIVSNHQLSKMSDTLNILEHILEENGSTYFNLFNKSLK